MLSMLPNISLTCLSILTNYSSLLYLAIKGSSYKNNSKFISFWDYSSNNKWPPYLLVNKKSKFHKIDLIISSKIS